MSNVTIKDIAAAAGVSHPTVSKVLNNASGVSEETRERIKRIAKQMDYVPNYAARNLANKRNRSLGLIWPDVEGLFYYHLCDTLHKEAAKRRIDVFVSMSGATHALRNFNEHFIDYVVCWFSPMWMPEDDFIREKEHFKGQITIIGGGRTEGANLILIDRSEGIFSAMQYLSTMGHKKIAFVGIDPEKIKGYMKGVLHNGLHFTPEYMITAPNDFYYGTEGKNGLAERFTALWRGRDRPTALILDSQGSAFAMINVLSSLGIRIPDELSIVSYDDIPEFSVYPVRLDTVSPSIHELIKLVLDDYEVFCQHGERRGETLKIIVPELIVRESVRKLDVKE
ncbi:MAG: LacI family transcriptional regulator [Clostridiales bacterium]|jgi:LacI family transcriptional regulator|nr:LacI family transcriptional regulator [Clostridiales bacterium]